MHTIAAEIEEISRVHAVKSGEQIGTGEKDSRYSSSKASIIRSKLVGRSALCISVQRTSINIGERRRAVAYRLRNSQWKIRELQICSSARQVGTHQTHLAAHGIKDDSYHDEYCVVIPKHIANSPTEISLQGLYNENKCLEDLEIRACGTYLINDREERQIVILICFTGLKNHLLSSITISINGEECHYTDITKLIHCQNWWSSSHSTEQCTNKTSCGNHQSIRTIESQIQLRALFLLQ